MAVSDTIRASVKGFRDFVLRGNVVDLAIAVVIGSAFAALVKSVNENFISAILAMIAGKPDFSSALVVTIHHGHFKFGAIITDALTFVLTAAIVYFVVLVPVNALLARFARGEVPETAPDPQLVLLAEIRDLLAAR